MPARQKSVILYRSQQDIDEFMKKVRPIIEDVKKRKDAAVAEYTKTFGGARIAPANIRVSDKEFHAAEKSLPEPVKKAIAAAVKNVRVYHSRESIFRNTVLSEVSRGVFAGTQVTPIDSVGMYVPHGKGRFPSMVYMLAVPAAIAQVPRRVIISPPNADGTIDPACLYAAKISGVHEVYKVGGAEGIAALAYGTKRIAPVSKIIGPGSAFVSAAKRFVANIVNVGLPAGPSESVIIADGTTQASHAAVDLCIEAEHGADSMALLITHKAEFAAQVCEQLLLTVSSAPAPTKKILTAVFTKYPPVIVTENEDDSVALCNQIAPEHLMIHSQSPSFIASDIRTAGEILMGEYTQFSLANYAAGPNAILPTGGMSRSYSGVAVSDFLRQSAIIKISKEGHALLSPCVQTLAEYEGFYFHNRALDTRKK